MGARSAGFISKPRTNDTGFFAEDINIKNTVLTSVKTYRKWQSVNQCHLVNIWTKSDVPLTGVHPSCWLQPAILLGLFYLKTLHLKIHFHGNYCFFQQKTQMDGVEPFLSGGLTILFDFFAEFYIST